MTSMGVAVYYGETFRVCARAGVALWRHLIIARSCLILEITVAKHGCDWKITVAAADGRSVLGPGARIED